MRVWSKSSRTGGWLKAISRQRIRTMADEIVNQAAPAAPAAASTTEGGAPAPRTGGYQGQGGPRTGGSRPPRPAGGGGAGGAGGRKFFRRKKVCKFTVEKIDTISYRDPTPFVGHQRSLPA
jgi:hypothetical protein